MYALASLDLDSGGQRYLEMTKKFSAYVKTMCWLNSTRLGVPIQLSGDTLAEFKYLVIDTKSNTKSIANRFQFIVTTWVCIFGKCLLSCLFINTEYLDARFVTNYKNPLRCYLFSLT